MTSGANTSAFALVLSAWLATPSFAAGIEPFADFYARVSSQRAVADAAPGAVADAASLDRMRRHLVDLYEGVSVKQSFAYDGAVFDCVPFHQQPGMKGRGPRAIPPAPPIVDAGAASGIVSQTPAGARDRFGNALDCDDGSIPMRRTTLEDMARFKSLEDFFSKGPDGAGRLDRRAEATHKYAHAYQKVGNYGGVSYLNLWNPPINTAKTHIFSLSQYWFSGYKGKAVQTVEAGWQHYPGLYGKDTKSVLFIYYTADGYNKTGCYNLTCKAFVQYDQTVKIGAGWSLYSSSGGDQYSFSLAAILYMGNWWIQYGGKNAGYYPATLFGTGEMASKATGIDFGGETVGTTNWPQMGGGKFASEGFKKAAYQYKIGYIMTAGTSLTQPATLIAQQPSPKCYTIDLKNKSKGDWATYFYFGGPGGTGC